MMRMRMMEIPRMKHIPVANTTHIAIEKPIGIVKHTEEEPKMDLNKPNTSDDTGVTENYQGETTNNATQITGVTEARRQSKMMGG